MTFTHKIQDLGLCYIITFLLKLKMACPKASNNRVQQQNWHLSNVWESPLLCWYGEVHIRTVCESGTKIRSWYWQVCNMEVVMRVSYKDTQRKKRVLQNLYVNSVRSWIVNKCVKNLFKSDTQNLFLAQKCRRQNFVPVTGQGIWCKIKWELNSHIPFNGICNREDSCFPVVICK